MHIITAKNTSRFLTSTYHIRKHTLFPSVKLSQQKTYPVSFYQIVTAENVSCFLLSNCHSRKHIPFLQQIVTAENIPCFLLPNCHSRKPIPFPSMKLSQQKTYPVSFYRIVRLRQLKLDVEALRLHLLWMVATPCPK